jgi:hypothetical protein
MATPAVRCITPLLLVAAAKLAHAAHPLISEDTGTQGSGKFELELGTSYMSAGGGRAFELDPQLSYGARDDLDLIVRPSIFWLAGSAADAAGRHAGLGTTALDFKWRAASYDSVSLGVRAGVDLPTASSGLGPRDAGAHAIGIATYEAPGVLATANIAYTRLGADDGAGGAVRRDVLRASAAYVPELNENVRLVIDSAVFQHPDPSVHTWPAVALVGAIAHLPMGFDVDVGWQGRLNRAAPASVWLAGVTFRW